MGRDNAALVSMQLVLVRFGMAKLFIILKQSTKYPSACSNRT
jgi:hypothetical protein